MTGSGGGADCWGCGSDSDAQITRMFVDIVQGGRIRGGQSPARRPVFWKPHGVAHGRFEVRPDLPPELRVGLFKAAGYPAWIRFSSDTAPTGPDFKTTLGIGIKLFDVPGPKLLDDGTTHDLILQNHDVFFVDAAQDMCAFTRAGVVEGDYGPYLKAHPRTKEISDAMAKVEASVLGATYWSGLPYAFGEDRFVKYKLQPEGFPGGLAGTDPNYLAADLARRLRAGEARFRFLVQFRKDPERMPLDRATVRWEESESEPVHVATLVLPAQDVAAPGRAAYGENLAFNPWHALAEHAPQGSISEARRGAYAASAEQRRDANGVPTREPGPARPACPAARPAGERAPARDTCIVRARIHPSIGVARVGNSEAGWFIGPEVAEPEPREPGFYRDEAGALKRQAARFRVYGLNAAGEVVAELDAGNAEIRWSVHLANTKAAWFQFQLAQDIPEAASAPPQLRRNASVADRRSLVIDPGVRRIGGRDASGGPEHAFDTGAFRGKPVYLGELRTDEAGRLVVLGGRGVSASHDGSRAITFANNDGWHDDVSDGPVTAEVRFEGKALKVDPAWVVVAPPNYAPLQKSVRTMWDLMRDVAVKAGQIPAPPRPSFARDIQPILERLSRLQWVNAGFAAAFGFGASSDLAAPERLAQLASPASEAREMRRVIANQFRVVDRDAWSPVPWPWLYGDAMAVPTPQTPRAFSTLSDLQMRFLAQWAAGDFEADYDPQAKPPARLEDVPVAEQGAMLDRAALEFCLADAFHPGCEMTWPMRQAAMYEGPFRVAHVKEGWIEPDFGPAFTPDMIDLPAGPIGPQAPGGLTRWMAVPWQTDTASCRSGYTPAYDPYVPTFWPARVPNQVLAEEDYRIVMDEDRAIEERLAAFATRLEWVRPLLVENADYTDQINNLVKDIGQMGVVETREGPGDPRFPATIEVENLPGAHHGLLAAGARSGAPARLTSDPTNLDAVHKARRFPQGLKVFR